MTRQHVDGACAADKRAGSWHESGARHPSRDGRLCSCSVSASILGAKTFHRSGPAPMRKLYEALAEAFLAEGVDTQFAMMGDGNWSTAFARLPGVQTIHVRHEHCAVAAATAYNIATDKIAAASV